MAIGLLRHLRRRVRHRVDRDRRGDEDPVAHRRARGPLLKPSMPTVRSSATTTTAPVTLAAVRVDQGRRHAGPRRLRRRPERLPGRRERRGADHRGDRHTSDVHNGYVGTPGALDPDRRARLTRPRSRSRTSMPVVTSPLLEVNGFLDRAFLWSATQGAVDIGTVPGSTATDVALGQHQRRRRHRRARELLQRGGGAVPLDSGRWHDDPRRACPDRRDWRRGSMRTGLRWGRRSPPRWRLPARLRVGHGRLRARTSATWARPTSTRRRSRTTGGSWDRFPGRRTRSRLRLDP